MAKTSKAGAIFQVLLLLGIGSCVVMMPKHEMTPAEKEADKFLSSQIRCELETKSRIADPEGFATAAYSDWRVVPDEQGEGYTFKFQAKAKNAFGALVWGAFSCHATYDGEYWAADITQE